LTGFIGWDRPCCNFEAAVDDEFYTLTASGLSHIRQTGHFNGRLAIYSGPKFDANSSAKAVIISTLFLRLDQFPKRLLMPVPINDL